LLWIREKKKEKKGREVLVMYFWVAIDLICVMKLSPSFISPSSRKWVCLCAKKGLSVGGETHARDHSVVWFELPMQWGRRMTKLTSNQRMGLSFVSSTMMIDLTLDESFPLLFLERVPMYLGYFFSCGVYYKEPWQGKTINIGTTWREFCGFGFFFALRK